jgi:cytidine deaminase
MSKLELQVIEGNICMRLPESLRIPRNSSWLSKLHQRAVRVLMRLHFSELLIELLSFGRSVHGELRGEALLLVIEKLRKIIDHSTCNGTRPARKKHAAAVVTADGYVFFGVNMRHHDTAHVRCAEEVALGNALAFGRRHISCIVVYSPDYVPKCCGTCLDKLTEHIDPRIGDLPIIYVGNGSNVPKVTTVSIRLTDGYSRTVYKGDIKLEPREEKPEPGTVKILLPDECRQELAGSFDSENPPKRTISLLKTHLASLMRRSDYWHAKDAGAPAIVAAVVTAEGIAYCAPNTRYGNPPNCRTAVANALGVAISDGKREFVLAVGFTEPDAYNDRSPFFESDRAKLAIHAATTGMIVAWGKKVLPLTEMVLAHFR